MLLFDRREFRVWRWWEIFFDVIIIYVISSFSAGLIASSSYLFLANLLFGQPFGNDFAWTRYVLGWTIQPCIFVGLLVTVGIGRGYSAEALWSTLPTWTWKPWLAVVAASVSWCVAQSWFLYAYFREEVLRDTEIFAYLFSTPLAGVVAIAAVAVAPVTEEVVFRRILLGSLTTSRLGFLGAAIFTSLLWAVAHFYSWPVTISVFASGIALCLLARSAGSIWPGVAAHAAFNASAVLFYLLFPST